MEKGSKVNSGAYGIVYDGKMESGDDFVVKRNLVDCDVTGMGSVRELSVLSAMRGHPHIVDIKCVSIGDPFSRGCLSPLGRDKSTLKDDKIHFIFEKADNDFADALYKGKLDYAQFKMFMASILLAVEYVHGRGYIHRDIKPTNLLLFKTSDGICLKLCDFGLAEPHTKQTTQPDNVVTIWYRAPEITLSDPKYSQKSDMWSVGCVFYEFFARVPYVGRIEKDDNHLILKSILSKLPKPISLSTFDKLSTRVPGLGKLITIDSLETGSTKPYTYHHPPTILSITPLTRTRRTHVEQMNLGSETRKKIEMAGINLSQLDSLLGKILEFDQDLRYSATQALNDDFFSSDVKIRSYISSVREKYVPVPVLSDKITIHICDERSWVVCLVYHIFNTRESLTWYSHRILFQSIDLFDRYISAMMTICKDKPGPNKINTRDETIVRYLVCIYLAIKFFCTIYVPPTYKSFIRSLDLKKINEGYVDDRFIYEPYLRIAGEFETTFVKDGLRYNVYHETAYEALDSLSVVATELQIRDLVMHYCSIPETSTLTGLDIAKEFVRKYNIPHFSGEVEGKKPLSSPPSSSLTVPPTPSLSSPPPPSSSSSTPLVPPPPSHPPHSAPFSTSLPHPSSSTHPTYPGGIYYHPHPYHSSLLSSHPSSFHPSASTSYHSSTSYHPLSHHYPPSAPFSMSLPPPSHPSSSSLGPSYHPPSLPSSAPPPIDISYLPPSSSSSSLSHHPTHHLSQQTISLSSKFMSLSVAPPPGGGHHILR